MRLKFNSATDKNKTEPVKYSLQIKNYIIVVLIAFFSFSSTYQTLSAQTLSKSDTSNVHFLNARKFYIYKVEKGETLFGISQKFKIPQEEILQFNHDIQKEGLKAKMKLWIPAYSWIKKDSIAEIKPAEIIPDKFIYQIAIVTTINLPKIYTEKDTSEQYVEEPLKKELKENLEFIEGVLHAAEMLKGEGLRAHIYIVDSENDSVRLSSKLKKIKDCNLIITNETGYALKCMNNFSQMKDVKLFSCATNVMDIIKTNKNAFSLIPSSSTQCEQMGRFASGYFTNAMPLTIKTPSTKENERAELFRNGWIKQKETHVKIVDYAKSGVNALADSLDKNKNNIVFISSSNEDLVSNLLVALKNKIPEYNVSVIGLPTWQYFETIDQKLIESCNVLLFSSGFIDYNYQGILNFRKYFRDKYNVEPSETAYQGYDALYVAANTVLMPGKKSANENVFNTIKSFYTDYTFKQTANGGAYENENIHVFQPANDVTVDLTKNFKMK